MGWSELSPQPTVDRRWNVRFAFRTLFLIVSSCWFSVVKAAILSPRSLQRRAPIADGVDITVLPIGDSITWGAQSSDDNGYRLSLHKKLTARGNNVNFVGSVSSGTFADDQHEGHRGFLIDEINTASDLGIYAAPNVVLLHAGTNDMYPDSNVGNAPSRLENLINKIFAHSPKAAVFVCQIIPSKTSSIQARIDDFNNAIPAVVSKYVDAGKHVTMVSMNKALSTSDLADFLHPNDGGYVKMADAYYSAIQEADEKDWIVEPGEAQKALGTIAAGEKGRKGTGVLFADLNGDGRDDYIYVDPSDGEVYGWINRLEKGGVWQWQSIGRIAGGVGATNKTLQMVDLDGDGRADFCLVNQNAGEVTAWLNTGADIVPDYYKLGVIATGSSASKGDTIFLGDLTGEGRADYMIVGDGDKVNGIINRLQATTLAPRWLEAFTFAEGPDGAKQDQVRLVDMTGDGKVDYLLVDEKTGKVTLWENLGTGGKYQPGEGVVLCDLDGDGTSDYFWLDHNGRGWGCLNTGKGRNLWNDLGQIANGPVRDRDTLRMGVLTHSGRADYIMVEEDTGRSIWWQNLGTDSGWGWASRGEAATGPSKTIENTYGWKFSGRNVRFADLDGDGFDDYLYVNDQGAVVMWKNLGTDPISWGLPHLVADGVGVLARQVQFADTNGDGLLDYNVMTGDERADYVAINPNNGALTLQQNRCNPINTLPSGDPPIETFPGDDGGGGGGPVDDPSPGTGDGSGGAGPVQVCDGDDAQDPSAHCVTMVPVEFPDDTCKGQRDTITAEMSWAYAMAKAAAEEPEKSDYYKHFFSEGLRQDAAFVGKIKTRFEKIAKSLVGGASPASIAGRQERPAVRSHARDNIHGVRKRGSNESESMESSSNTGLRLQRRAPTSCTLPDYIVWDKDEDEGLKVTGYAHFGDSYASGIGTGVTTGDKCRIGSNNYGDLINNFFDDESVVWPGPLSCSGDTTVELVKRIDGWKTAKNTNVATLTIGGNDVGFSDLCAALMQEASDIMDDGSDDGLKAGLTAAYLKIMQEGLDAHGPGLDLYVAGYPSFFESETEDCNYSSFDFYWSGYHYVHGDNIVMLAQELRRQLNDLVDHLNDVIGDAVKEANNAWGSYRIHFVRMQDRFAGGADHRWCATEDVHEPDPDRKDTWFFLSGWPDVDSTASAQQDESEGLELAAQGKITLPPCDEDSPLNKFAGNDPWDVWRCRFAQVIADDPDGDVAERLAKANADLSDGNYQTDDVKWYYPTRQIKTFHPRTTGMRSYRDAIIAALEADGKL
ncbi:SGNH hydrolase-type esterase domain-containing protein [Xylaria acuta]|nr:SGNH hydrolase-type esterase domain-containing protein [Xylaria acuta]